MIALYQIYSILDVYSQVLQDTKARQYRSLFEISLSVDCSLLTGYKPDNDRIM